MSFAAPVAPGAQRRPGAVTAAGYALYLVAVLLVINAVLPLPSSGKVADALRQAYANSTNPTPDSVATGYRVGIVAATIVTIILAVGVAILAAFDLRGSRVSRIITWVAAGLGVLCLGCGLGGGLTGEISSTSTTSGGVSTDTVNRLVKQAQPGWVRPTSTTLSVIGLLALILVIILLALPSSHPFFRGRGPGTPGGGDPAYPNLAYPPVPGPGPYPQPPIAPDAPPAHPGHTPPADQPPAPPTP
ncbi:hypothetical protein GCM10023322_00910 [Rugosimonospora acidiphila]|uniref:Uncharacterized protein n=1 Tax=Rugosimonospora acidiphila TaxID=556531 RepID=A0ABP9RGY9_9ACTN